MSEKKRSTFNLWIAQILRNIYFEKSNSYSIIGAADTVNYTADENPNSPIAECLFQEYGLQNNQLLSRDRSRGFGYTAIDDPAFYKPNNNMQLGDIKKTCDELTSKVKGHFKS